jgi:proteasome lid subunit RPN8/RPN11
LILLHRRQPLPIDGRLEGHQLLVTQDVSEAIRMRLPKTVAGEYHENVLYLGGRRAGLRAVALTVLQPYATTTPGSFRTGAAAHQNAFRLLRRHNLELIGQVHCHPGVSVEHSDGDDENAIIRHDGFWSLVVPDYGQAGMSLAKTGFHCYSEGAFRLLSSDAAARRVIFVPAVLGL